MPFPCLIGAKFMTRIWILSTLVVIGIYGGGCATKSPSAYRHPEFDLARRYKVVVLPFGDAPRYPGSGGALTSLFETALLASNRCSVVERSTLDRALHDQRSKTQGESDDPVSVGKLVQADLVVTGKTTNWIQGWSTSVFQTTNTMVGASIKVVSVEKGIVFCAIDKSAQADYFSDGIPIDGPVDAVARKLCRKIVDDIFLTKGEN
jgi:hypothetical protein